MGKLNVAIIFGGCSSEYLVSLESATAVIKNMNPDRYNTILLGITREGGWYYFFGDVEEIRKDTWHSGNHCVPAILSPNRGGDNVIIFGKSEMKLISADVVFPILHGRNGEDGTVQGLIELSGLPIVGCKTLASALCMDKDRAHRLVEKAGIRVPQSMVYTEEYDIDEIKVFAGMIGYPLFVKPVKAGSSYGITKVQSADALVDAIQTAFEYDDEIIVEENIEGFEVGCAVLGMDELLVGEVDEIELAEGFFDYTEKYTLKTSAIHVPARISNTLAEDIKQYAKRIYRTLGCSGFARVDMFVTPEGEVVFNEVNTIPGFTEHSRYPGMMKAAGYDFKTVLDMLIEQAVKEC